MHENTGSGPLAGVRVLDLSAYIAGPYGCTLLADQGAEVIKIEPPWGDNLRNYPSTLPNESRAFLGINRGKLGVALDLKKPVDLKALLQLVDHADVLVHNFRPSVPQRLGIDYETLKARNPHLIYCALTGYGDSGPLKDSAGYDQVLQTMTGICTFQGAPGEPTLVYGSVVDYYSSALMAGSVASALYQRERTHRGEYINVSLLGSALAMQSARFVWAKDEQRDVWRDMRSGGVTGLHPTREGSLYISANTPHFWNALCELTGLAEIAENPRYDSVRKRAEHADEIVPHLHRALQAHTALEWKEIFGDKVPCAAARPIEDMFDDPQVIAQHLVHTYTHPTVGEYRGLIRPIHFGGQVEDEPRGAPTLGQHTEQVLRASGLNEAQLDEQHAPPGTRQKRTLWSPYLSAQDLAVLRRGGFGKRMGFGQHPALVIIDAQKYMVGEADNDDAWPSSCGEPGRRAVSAIARAVRVAQQRGVACFFTRFELARDGSDIGGYRHKRDLLETDHWCLVGSSGAELVDDLQPAAEDVVFVKKKPSGFQGTPLLGYLIDRSVDTVIVMGGATSNCIRATVFDAASYNFRAIVPQECVFDRIPVSHAISLFDMDRQFADVVNVQQVMDYLQKNNTGKGPSGARG